MYHVTHINVLGTDCFTTTVTFIQCIMDTAVFTIIKSTTVSEYPQTLK